MNTKTGNINKSSAGFINENPRSFYLSPAQQLQNGNLDKAEKGFLESGNIYGFAYCKFLKGEIDEAEKLLERMRDLNPFVNWLLCLIDIIKGTKNEIPAYFQVRNFYEQDMNMLIKYENYDFAEEILKNTDYLAQFNKEVYKFAARVFMDNNEYEKAEIFLKESIYLFYNDPESHFMLAETYLALGSKMTAKEEYQKADAVSSGYGPAQNKLKMLEENHL